MPAVPQSWTPIGNWVTSNGYASGIYAPPTVAFADVFNTQPVTTNTLRFAPFIPRASQTFDRLAWYNSSAAENGRKFRLGIWSSTNGRPSTLLQDGGETILGAAAAINLVTISQTLNAGTLYFVGLVGDTDITGSQMQPSGGTNQEWTDTIVPSLLGKITLSSIVPFIGYTQSFTYGALTNAGSTFAEATTIPYICLRAV